jgi:fatty acid desaturase
MKLHRGDICKKGYKTPTLFALIGFIGFVGTLITRAWFHGFPPKEHTPLWIALFFAVIVFTILFLKGVIGHFVYIYIHKEECLKKSSEDQFGGG